MAKTFKTFMELGRNESVNESYYAKRKEKRRKIVLARDMLNHIFDQKKRGRKLES